MRPNALDLVRRHVGITDKRLGRRARVSESAASLIVRAKRNADSPAGQRIQRVLLAEYRKRHPGEMPARVGSRQLAATLQTIAAQIALDNAARIIDSEGAGNV